MFSGRLAKVKFKVKGSGRGRPLHTSTSPQADKATLISERGLYLCRQLPTLPHSCSAGAPARERPMAEDSSMTFRRVKSSHFGCVQVTDRFDLFGHTHESQIQSQRQRAGAPAPHIHDSQHMTQASLKGKYEYWRRLPHYQKDDRALFVT